MKSMTLAAACLALAPLVANADAMSDQAKAYKMLGAMYNVVRGLGEPACTAYSDRIGYEAAVLPAKGVTQIQMSGRGSAATALGLLKLAMNR